MVHVTVDPWSPFYRFPSPQEDFSKAINNRPSEITSKKCWYVFGQTNVVSPGKAPRFSLSHPPLPISKSSLMSQQEAMDIALHVDQRCLVAGWDLVLVMIRNETFSRKIRQFTFWFDIPFVPTRYVLESLWCFLCFKFNVKTKGLVRHKGFFLYHGEEYLFTFS